LSLQIALGWLLQRSPAMLPIPGTSSIAHLGGQSRICVDPLERRWVPHARFSVVILEVAKSAVHTRAESRGFSTYESGFVPPAVSLDRLPTPPQT